MRYGSWFYILALVFLGGRLQAQEHRVDVRLGLAGEWSTIPGHVDYAQVAGGTWGGSATLEIRHPAMPRLAFVTRVGHVPQRVSPATPTITTLAGGVRLALWDTGRLTTSTSLEIEGVYFGPGAYNLALSHTGRWRAEHDAYDPGWRGGVRLSPAMEFWPTGTMGFQFAPALRWLGPVGTGGPASNVAYVTFGLGILFRLRP